MLAFTECGGGSRPGVCRVLLFCVVVWSIDVYCHPRPGRWWIVPPRFLTSRRQTGSARLRPSTGCGMIFAGKHFGDCEDRAPIRVVMDLPSMSEPPARPMESAREGRKETARQGFLGRTRRRSSAARSGGLPVPGLPVQLGLSGLVHLVSFRPRSVPGRSASGTACLPLKNVSLMLRGTLQHLVCSSTLGG